MGIEELKHMLHFVLTGVEVGFDVAKDGKVGIDDLGLVMKIIPAIGPAFDHLDQIPAELNDLSTEEAAELVAFVMSELVIDDAKAKLVIEKGLKAVVASYELYKAIKA